MTQKENKTGCLGLLLWPFTALWNLIAGIIKLTGRLVAVVLGIVLMIAGFVLTVTVIGALVGVPLMVVGQLLVVRGLF